MYQYYLYLTDAEVEERIQRLTSNQKQKFERTLLETDDRRQALFVASSYPMVEK